jgi:hypothetical protein
MTASSNNPGPNKNIELGSDVAETIRVPELPALGEW